MRPELQLRVQRYGWDYSSPHYETGWQRQLRPAQERLLETTPPREGEKVLDISCGTGLVTFPIAGAVGPGGAVTGVDLSEGMIEKAREEAQERGLEQCEFRRMDAEELDLEEGSFDLAINSLGIMYYPDPPKAVEEMYRVVKGGGRASALVWGRRSECGWAGIFPIVDRRVQTDVCPLFFQPGTGDQLKQYFEAAGFGEVRSDRFSVDLRYETEEEAIVGAFLGGAVAMAYRKFDEQTREEAHAEYLESIAPFKKEGVYHIPGEFLIVSGRKA